MRVLVCGSRHFNDYSKLCLEMDRISTEYDFDNRQPITIIHGAARGADTLAGRYAEECGFDVRAFPALWDKYGKSAGPIRNALMLSEGKPDLCIAFRGPNSRGTQNMINQAEKAGVKTMVVNI